MANINFLEAFKLNETRVVKCLATGFEFQPGKMYEVEFWTPKCVLNEWQIVEPTVTITKTQLAEAWDKSMYAFPAESSDIFKALCKELGMG